MPIIPVSVLPFAASLWAWKCLWDPSASTRVTCRILDTVRPNFHFPPICALP
jgi:hypothetical protein